MMHFNQLSMKKLDEIKPQSDKLRIKLQAKEVFVRSYSGSHYNWYLIASLIHWELCLLDNTNLKTWLEHFPGLIDFANLYAENNDLRHIELEQERK
tara:strand:- start:151 stop:438 length:288 start_codon:yes stop_codon:yes gene_type:complete